MLPNTNRIRTGFSVKWVFLIVYARLILFLIGKYKNPSAVKMYWKKIQQHLRPHQFEQGFHKLVLHEGRYYLSCNFPGFPAPQLFDKLLSISNSQANSTLDNIGIVQIALTKKCPLNCEHCYEGKVLNQPEGITLDEHLQIVEKLQAHQVSVIQYGGGEPLHRFADLLTILNAAQNNSDFWIYTSGYGLTMEKAELLKLAGLTGVSVSIDHFDAAAHNEFRRNEKSFDWAINAVKHAKHAKLLVALSICVTNDFCSRENLLAYLDLAKKLDADFVQILEPRAAGNYEGKDVAITPENIQTLEQFFIEVTTTRPFKKYPIVQYYAYQQRRIGCIGAAERYIYIDTDGNVQACPFCVNKKAHFLYGELQKDLNSLKTEGCYY